MEFSERVFRKRIASMLSAAADQTSSAGQDQRIISSVSSVVDLSGTVHPLKPERGRIASLLQLARRAVLRLLAALKITFYARSETINQNLARLLHELSVRTDRLSAKTDEALWTLSAKLDNYVADLQQRHHELRETVVEMPKLLAEDFDPQLTKLQQTSESLKQAVRDLGGRLEMEQTEARKTSEVLDQRLAHTDKALRTLSEGHHELLETIIQESARTASQIAEIHECLSVLTSSLQASASKVSTLLDQVPNLEKNGDGRLRRIESCQAETAQQLDRLCIVTADGQRQMTAEMAEAKNRIRSPVLLGGSNILVTELDGFIVGVPGEEWRMAAYHAFRGVLEPGVTRLFRNRVKPGMVVVDVGANIGMYTLYAARLLEGKGKAYSFEPTARTFEILKDNIQVNGFLELGIVELHQVAVTDSIGSARLFVFPNNCGHNTLFGTGKESAFLMVPTTTLDEVLKNERRIDVVKIDAEGAEPFILRGMTNIIARSPDLCILMEFAPAHLRRAGVDPLGFLDEISALGFAVRRIHDESGELMNISPDELVSVFSANLELVRRPA